MEQHSADVKCEVELPCCVQNIARASLILWTHMEEEMIDHELAKEELVHYFTDEE